MSESEEIVLQTINELQKNEIKIMLTLQVSKQKKTNKLIILNATLEIKYYTFVSSSS